MLCQVWFLQRSSCWHHSGLSGWDRCLLRLLLMPFGVSSLVGLAFRRQNCVTGVVSLYTSSETAQVGELCRHLNQFQLSWRNQTRSSRRQISRSFRMCTCPCSCSTVGPSHSLTLAATPPSSVHGCCLTMPCNIKPTTNTLLSANSTSISLQGELPGWRTGVLGLCYYVEGCT